MGVEKKMIGARVDPDVVKRLEEICERDNRSMSNLVETILKDYLSRIDKKS